MAAVTVHQFAQCITCHAWSQDHSMNIYKLMGGKWVKWHSSQSNCFWDRLGTSSNRELLFNMIFSGTFRKLYGQSKSRINYTDETLRRHDNSITSRCIVFEDLGDTTVTSFGTSGLDGKVIIWDLEKQNDLLEYLER